MPATLIYVHDPMCSWCWAFRPTLQRLREALPADIGSERLLGGLAADSDQPMPAPMQQGLQDTWRRIQQQVPGTEFNFAFWRDCTPRRSTYPACRAVIAARSFDPPLDEAMTLAIQQAYYLQARNPSEPRTLIELAGEIGLDRQAFAGRLAAHDTERQLRDELARARRLHADSFPSLILYTGGDSYWPVAVDYRQIEPMLDQITMLNGI